MKRIKKLLIGFIICMLYSFLSTTAMAYSTGNDYYWKDSTPNADYDDYGFVKRNCTSFVAWCLNTRNGVEFTNWYGSTKADQITWSAAYNWGNAANQLGIRVDNNPEVGAVAWNSFGHVAWVREVDGDEVTIEEYNWEDENHNGDFSYHERTMHKNDYSGFIHIKDISGSNYTITFYDNGGSGGPGSRVVTTCTSNYGDISWKLPTKSNDTFLGYYTQAVGGEQVYDRNGHSSPGTYWTRNNIGGLWNYAGDVLLFAHWSSGNVSTSHSITFNDNGGTSGPGTRPVTAGTSNYGDISRILPTKANDTFIGYYTEIIGGEQVYDANGFACPGTYWSSKSTGGLWQYDGDIIIYAHWGNHTITFNDNGGSGGPGSRTVTTGTSNYGDISWALPHKENDTFTGYYTKLNGGEKVYDANGFACPGTYWSSKSTGGLWQYDGDIILYAHWLNHTITFNDNGGAGGPGSRIVTTGTSNYGDISWALPQKVNDSFIGYYSKLIGGEKVYDANGFAISGTYWNSMSDGGHWKYDGDVTLYAHWSSGYSGEQMEPDLVLPSSLINIEAEAFRGTAFTCVKLSAHTETIGQFAFADCANLHGIYISATTTIDPNAFDGQTNLTIYGLNGSAAEQYARQHGFQFVTIDSSAFSN